MRVTGFSFIRNAVKYDYPIVEAITSILPLCDDFVVALGNSEDDTHDLIKNISPDKIKIISTIWDDSLRQGGKVLAQETNKAFQAISDKSDWAFYIQGDEVIHEEYLETLREAMTKWKDDPKVDGLLLNYKHFYGSYDYVGNSSKWYQNEIRVIKNNKSIYSFKDAQGFRKGHNEILGIKPVDAFVFHYGWVKEPGAMQRKQEDFHKLWHDDDWIKKKIIDAGEFDYSGIDSLEYFTGTHPQVMLDRISKRNWKFEHDLSKNKRTFKDRIKQFLKKYLRIDSSYKNYKVVK